MLSFQDPCVSSEGKGSRAPPPPAPLPFPPRFLSAGTGVVVVVGGGGRGGGGLDGIGTAAEGEEEDTTAPAGPPPLSFFLPFSVFPPPLLPFWSGSSARARGGAFLAAIILPSFVFRRARAVFYENAISA